MPYGMQIRSASSNVLIDLSQTMLREVASVIVPFGYGSVIGATSTYSVPEFDDTLGMFSWRDYLTVTSSIPPPRRAVPFQAANWSNGSKILTVTHAAASSSAGQIQFIFMHYR